MHSMLWRGGRLLIQVYANATILIFMLIYQEQDRSPSYRDVSVVTHTALPPTIHTKSNDLPSSILNSLPRPHPLLVLLSLFVLIFIVVVILPSLISRFPTPLGLTRRRIFEELRLLRFPRHTKHLIDSLLLVPESLDAIVNRSVGCIELIGDDLFFVRGDLSADCGKVQEFEIHCRAPVCVLRGVRFRVGRLRWGLKFGVATFRLFDFVLFRMNNVCD